MSKIKKLLCTCQVNKPLSYRNRLTYNFSKKEILMRWSIQIIILIELTDIFAECSTDYDKNNDTAITFYKIIQNKFHYVITGNIAVEIVYNRANSKREIWDLQIGKYVRYDTISQIY